MGQWSQNVDTETENVERLNAPLYSQAGHILRLRFVARVQSVFECFFSTSAVTENWCERLSMSYKDAEMLVRAAELGEDSLQVLHMFKRVNIKILIIAALNPLLSSPVSRK